jgi:hypothetical protein
VEAVNAADETWTSGSLQKQGERWRTLRAHLGSDAATDAAMREEAALYGVKPGTTQKGTAPSSVKEDKTTPAAGLSSRLEDASAHAKKGA